MTEIAVTARKTTAAHPIREALTRFIDWLNEPVAADTLPQLSSRDWADLPSHHPIRDDTGAR